MRHLLSEPFGTQAFNALQGGKDATPAVLFPRP
jgi:hypothetical protein